MKTLKTQGVYGITLVLDGRVYVGSSNECERRLQEHLHDLRLGKHENPYLQNAWNKHGEENFLFEILEVVKDKIWLRAREQAGFSRFHSCDPKFGFNISKDAWWASVNHDPETLKRKTEKLRQYLNLPEVKAKRSKLMKDVCNRPGQREKLQAAGKLTAKPFELIDPKGKRFSGVNLKAFCLANNLVYTKMCGVNNGEFAYSGWKYPSFNEEIHKLEISRIRSKAGIKRYQNPKERERVAKNSTNWHHNPNTLEARKLRGLHISQSKKGKKFNRTSASGVAA
jgi:group I intron endonuclease